MSHQIISDYANIITKIDCQQRLPLHSGPSHVTLAHNFRYGPSRDHAANKSYSATLQIKQFSAFGYIDNQHSGPAKVTVSIQSQAPDSDKPGDPDNPKDLEDPSDTSDPNSGGGCFIGLSYQ